MKNIWTTRKVVTPHRGGSVEIKRQKDDLEDAVANPSFAIPNKSSKLMSYNPALASKQFPLNSGVPTSTGGHPNGYNERPISKDGPKGDRNHLGGALNIKFGKQKKDEKVKLKI